MRNILLRNVRAITFFSLVGLSAFTQAQDSASTNKQQGSAERHDQWRRTPQAIPPQAQDPERAALLEARGRFFDQFSKTRVPLDKPQPTNVGSSSSIGIRQELPQFPGEVAVVATFEDYQAYLSPSHLSTYTDIDLLVEDVIQAGDAHIEGGQRIDLLEHGGAIQMPDGKTIDDVPYEEIGKYSIQPGHRYVFLLEYHSKGNFFKGFKHWELKDGFVLPDSPDDIDRARSGQSKYAGMREGAFINMIREDLKQAQSQN